MCVRRSNCLYAATSEIPQLEQQIQQQENAIAFLIGENPGPIVHSDPNALAPPPQDLPTGLPSQLLERRPDIQQAEATLVAANAQIGVARAQFFPNFPSALRGAWVATVLQASSTLQERRSTALGTLAQPLFEGGKLRGQLQYSQETKKEMVLNYQKTISGAFRDVSNALIALNKQRAYREQQEKLVEAAKDATRLARIRYQGGSTGIPRSADHRFKLVRGTTEPGECATRRSTGARATVQRARRRLAILILPGLWSPLLVAVNWILCWIHPARISA